MISNVFLLGKVGKIIDDERRFIEVDRVTVKDGKIETDNLIAKYWNRRPGNHFMKMNEGNYIGVKGRLENDEKYGVIIIIEQINTVCRGELIKEKIET